MLFVVAELALKTAVGQVIICAMINVLLIKGAEAEKVDKIIKEHYYFRINIFANVLGCAVFMSVKQRGICDGRFVCGL